MYLRLYGKADPTPNDKPVGGVRSSTLAYIKAVSYFMTSTTEWNKATKTGNSTKSPLINNLIKAMKKEET